MTHRTHKWLIATIVIVALAISVVGIAVAQSPDPAKPAPPANEKIGSALATQLAAGSADYIIRFKEQADLSPAYQMGWKERGEFVYNTLSQTAEKSQAGAKALLDGNNLRYQTFIAGNELYVWGGNLDSANSLAALPEVENIRETRVYQIDPVRGDTALNNQELTWVGDLLKSSYGPAPAPKAQSAPQGIMDWGITDTNADDFWSAFGMQGDGIVVANIDTGVQWDHPALVDQFKCAGDPSNPACWSDPSNICGGSACDNNGHGTHTMGTMAGSDDPALDYNVGMAPNSQWIACKGCESSSCSDLALNSCADWILAPGGSTANRPNVVNNSWGGGGGSDWYLAKVQAWRAAGIFPAFSAGNSYSCSSLGSPGDYQESFGTASHRSWDRLISDFSSKGPSYYGDDPYTKPNLSAPGENICSTVPGNGWDCTYSGTSMASPHTAGAVALLWSCNPGLIGNIDETFEILQESTDAAPDGSCGAPVSGEGNYTYGYGYLNIYNAGLLWCGDIGSVAGTVTNADTGDPIAGADVFSTPGPYATTTGPDGEYNLTMQVGTYDVTVQAFGYYPETATVEIVKDETTPQDFALEPAPASLVSGNVTDSETGWPLYAWVAIAGYPGGGVWTDPVTGYYEVSLPDGQTYDFTVSAWVPGYIDEARSVGPLAGNRTEDFALDADLAACAAPGYTTFPYGENFEADNGGFTLVGTGSWQWGNPTSGPGEAHSGNNVWATNLSGQYNNSENSYLVSPIVNLSSLAGQSFDLSWWQYLQSESNYDYAEVQVSNNGGVSWTTVYGPVSGWIDLGWTKHVVTLDPSFATGNFRVRFHFWTDGSVVYNGWYIDDISIGTCTSPADGGLVVGNVYDSNEDMPLTGAAVSNDAGFSTITTATDDPAVDDSFYTLFSPAGEHDFTASYDGFTPVTEPVDVLLGDTVLHDFSLPAGYLVVDPASLHSTVDMGTSDTMQMTLSNIGDGEVSYELNERDRGFQPALVENGVGEWLYRAETGVEMVNNKGETTLAFPKAYRWTSAWPSAMNVLIYADDYYHYAPNTFLDQALQELGISYTAHYDADWTGFVNDLQAGGWDLVLVGNDNYSDSSWLAPLDSYIQAGGMAIVHSWTVDAVTPLWTTLGITWIANDYDPPDPVYWWEPGNPIFTDPEEVPEFTQLEGGRYITYGQQVEPLADFQALAGYTTPGPDPNLAAMVLGNDNRTVFKGFLDGQNDADLDTDGMLDGVELWINLISGIETGFSVDVPWLSESPISGTLTSDGWQVIDVTFDAGAVSQPGDYLADLKVKNDTPYGTLTIPVTMTVIAPDSYGKLEGIVTGLGYCDANPGPAVEAEVLITSSSGMTWTLMTDDAGYYSFWFDEAGSPFTVAISYPEHEDGEETGVVVTGGETTTVDFDLRWLEPCVSVDPGVYDFDIAAGYQINTILDLFNDGAEGTIFEIREQDKGLIPPVSLSSSDGKFPRGKDAPSTGRAPVVSDEANGEAGTYAPLAGAPAYAMDVYPGYNLVHIPDVDFPGVWSIIQNIPGNQFFAGDFIDGDFSTLWVIDYGTNMLKAVDTTTGAVTDIGPSTPFGGESWTGMTGSVGGEMYAASTNISRSTLYTVDLMTGAVTVVGQITNANCVIDLAITPDDVIYAVDICLDALFSVDPATGAGTLIGSIGFDANYAQGMDYEEESGILYLAAYNNSSYQGELRIADTSTGNSVLVGAFPGGAETDALAFATGGGVDVPWVSEAPITGTLEADSMAPIDVTFDSMTYTVGTQLMAMLKVRTDDPFNGTIQIPITMTIAEERYGADVGPDQALRGAPGETVTYQVEVRNASNGPVDSFDITLSGSDWASTTTTEVGSLDAWESETIDVVVEIPADAALGYTDEVVVTATSQADDAVSDSATLATTVFVSLVLDPAEDAKTAFAGESATYTITCTNFDEPDEFTLSLSAHTWDVQLSVESFSLGTGEDEVITVTVTIPEDADPEDFETVVLTATGLSGATASSVLTTTAESGTIYLPLVMDGHTQ